MTLSIYIINKIIGKPLSTLIKDIKLIKEGAYKVKNVQNSDDEIGKISQTIAAMAETIKSREKDLALNLNKITEMHKKLECKVEVEVEKNRKK
ncbi:MAG: hypothetical protein GQ474_07210 [Sulfurimonas sp.]|nr:hypothetical protein [Sulfurimonas sp.]